ncbi:MAG: glycosyltransferase [Acidobacteriota bacterium]|nr:glycosyltransferase [Acidobacteriota bacterium]
MTTGEHEVLMGGRDFVCISSVDWDELWQSHHDICTQLARAGNRVLFIENTGVRGLRLSDLPRLGTRFAEWNTARKTGGVLQIEERLNVIAPLVLPPVGRINRELNRRIFLKRVAAHVRDLGFRDPVVWTYLPTDTALDLYEMLATPASRFVYYCLADFREIARDARATARFEQLVVERADVVFTNREEFAARFRAWNSNVSVQPVALNLGAFNPETAVPDPAICELPRPRIGCVAGLHELKIDFDFIVELARLRPDWQWIYVGPQRSPVARLAREPNITLIDQVPHAQLASYIAAFDVCTVPYRRTEFMRNAVPTKIHEYLAMGKPVVSTPLDFVNELAPGLVRDGGWSASSFVAAIEAALRDTSPRAMRTRRAAAVRETWDVRLREMSEVVAGTF